MRKDRRARTDKSPSCFENLFARFNRSARVLNSGPDIDSDQHYRRTLKRLEEQGIGENNSRAEHSIRRAIVQVYFEMILEARQRGAQNS